MVQESNFKNKTIGIVGAGPAGVCCAKFLHDTGLDVTIFDKGKFLRTILPTGGNRCNLAFEEFDFKELAKNYPRGEKFLYSIFSRFGTSETLEFFNSIGIKTYTQEDKRIFPISNSSKDVREKFLSLLPQKIFQREEVVEINNKKTFFEIKTTKSSYAFDYVVIAIGGHGNFDLLKNLGINIIPPTQSLVGLNSLENFYELIGISLKNISIKVDKKYFQGDILFTHNGVSGPAIYKISSVFARKNFPYKINLSFVDKNYDLQKILNENPHKEIKNVIHPKALSEYILNSLNINLNTPCHKINGKTRDKIIEKLTNFEINITGKNKQGEIVTCGGVDLKEINPKTMNSKQIPNLYFCGEVIDIDGFCGGFNLQNCWSSAFIASQSIISQLQL